MYLIVLTTNNDKTKSPQIIAIVGPTASGKSASAISLAQQIGGEIICMDSATIYKGMDIGTAKPDQSERDLIHHHLLDIRDPAQSYSAADFAQDAAKIAEQINAQNKTPIICGGTMLYYKALFEGLNNLPSANPEIRQQIEDQAKSKGWPAMHALLNDIDPITAARLAPNDSQRLQRALEIYHSSGKTMSDWLSEKRQPLLDSWNFTVISLEPNERSQLHTRIADRYHCMLDLGLLDEVKSLYARSDLNPSLPSIRCVGYRQIWDYLEGQISLDLAIEQAITATRQLAKRQITWLRSMPDRHIINCLAKDAQDQVQDYVLQKLNPSN